jgi:NAD(P)-dependent dehydrogenase (short-subunit alcohol dehydrogenase family)
MKVAVVGSNKGIGLEIVKNLTKENHEVFAFCRKASTELKDTNPTALIENFEVTDSSSMSSTLKNLNTDHFDWVFHVSGVLESESLESFNEDTVLKQFKINSMGPVLSTKAFLPYLKKGSQLGLLTSRMGSITDNTSGGMYGYRMSKAALNVAGKSLSEDLKDQDIAVLLLHPGYVKTDMTNNNGNLTPAESAEGLIKLMSEKSIKDTGTFWHVNGENLPW